MLNKVCFYNAIRGVSYGTDLLDLVSAQEAGLDDLSRSTPPYASVILQNKILFCIRYRECMETVHMLLGTEDLC